MPNFKSISFKMAVLQEGGGGGGVFRICPPHVCVIKKTPCGIGLNQSFVDGMSNSQRQAVITLIEKKGKDKRYIQNWCPILLINVYAKVASKCLALRLKKVVHTLVDSHQTANVPGRNIGE